MKWVKNAKVTSMLKAEIKAATGATVSVRQSGYGNITVDFSDAPESAKAKIESIIQCWRSGTMDALGNRHYFTMFSCVNPATGKPVIWNRATVVAFNIVEFEQVNVYYDYIGRSW